jgi:predicted Rossmann fold nucleotide-binding protein DprA/Smf involved in DNA uptake
MKLLDNSGMDMDEIVRSIGMPPASVLEALMTLELERCISRRGNIVEKA